MTLREARMTKYTRQIIISYYSATCKYNPYINGNPNDVLNLENDFDNTPGNHWGANYHHVLLCRIGMIMMLICIAAQCSLHNNAVSLGNSQSSFLFTPTLLPLLDI